MERRKSAVRADEINAHLLDSQEGYLSSQVSDTQAIAAVMADFESYDYTDALNSESFELWARSCTGHSPIARGMDAAEQAHTQAGYTAAHTEHIYSGPRDTMRTKLSGSPETNDARHHEALGKRRRVDPDFIRGDPSTAPTVMHVKSEEEDHSPDTKLDGEDSGELKYHTGRKLMQAMFETVMNVFQRVERLEEKLDNLKVDFEIYQRSIKQDTEASQLDFDVLASKVGCLEDEVAAFKHGDELARMDDFASSQLV